MAGEVVIAKSIDDADAESGPMKGTSRSSRSPADHDHVDNGWRFWSLHDFSPVLGRG